jgi:hypothetical protein
MVKSSLWLFSLLSPAVIPVSDFAYRSASDTGTSAKVFLPHYAADRLQLGCTTKCIRI